MRPFVSILVTTYAGHEQNLLRALYSINQQSYGHFEVIVVDDGSQATALPNWLTYVRLRPYGAGPRSNLAAYQEAYRHSRGEFIVLTDADMLVPRPTLRAMVKEWQHDGRIAPIAYGLDESVPVDDYLYNPDHLQNTRGFPEFHTPQGVYNAEARTVKHHLLFVGMRRDLWNRTGLFDTTQLEMIPEHYMAAYDQRPICQIPVGVYHQWHERGEQYSARVRRIREHAKD